MKICILFTMLVSLLAAAHGYHILAIQHIPTRSHHSLVMGLVTPLLDAGHKVTLISAFPEKNPVKNLRIIDISFVQSSLAHLNLLEPENVLLVRTKERCAKNAKKILQTPEVREALIKGKFDAFISELFLVDIEAGYAAVLQIPWIVLYATEISPDMEYLVDTVRSISTIPTTMNDAPIPMNIWQRLKNTINYGLMIYEFIMDYSWNKANYKEFFEDIARARGVSLPPYSEAIHNISVLFTNSHPSYTPAQVLPPNVVEIGGYHIDDDIPPLPKDLQELLDNSKNGVIYFSMGSVLKSKLMPDQTKKDLIELFGELPYTVLWKFEEQMEKLPKNLHIRPWMPQLGILSHPNVKVFMTHSGALSTIEALKLRVPILAIPVFADQLGNAEKAVQSGRALKVPYSPDMVGELRVALNEMIRNDSYYQRAQYLSSIFNKRPLSPRKLIQNYVELAIESKGAYHLRSKTQLYKWYETWMLDQVAILLAVLLVLYVSVKKIVSLVVNRRAKVKVQKME